LVSRSTSARPLAIGRAALALLFTLGCGPEDIELAPPERAPPPPDECSAAIPEGTLAARPPMGWNGYNALGCEASLDEAKLLANVDALVTSGMQSAGYHYVNLDDCLELERAEDGQRQFDPARLPSGIVAFSEYVHSRGLSLGIRAPIPNCGGIPGTDGYEALDAATFASWGVDYVKSVLCGGSELAVRNLAEQLLLTGRPMVLSLAAAPFEEWMREVGNLWRTTGDARPTWSSLVTSIDTTVPLAAYAHPGAFNDPDMLEIGNGALTLGEQRVQFSAWSILSAPLIAGNDLTVMSEDTRIILTNAALIAINQDPLGLQAALVRSEGDVDVLAKPLSPCGARAAVLWNRGDADATVSVKWPELFLAAGPAQVHDLWANAPLASAADGFTVTVPSHDAVAVRVTGVEPPRPAGHVYLSDLPWTYVTNGYGPVELDRTNGENFPLDGAPIRLRGTTYEKGLGVHGPSLIRYRLGRACSRFVADVGIDDDQRGNGSVSFQVWADGERLYESGRMTGESPTRAVSVDLTGRWEIRLFVGIGEDTFASDHAVWAGARLECAPAGATP
jgi:alpha-galactosidase